MYKSLIVAALLGFAAAPAAAQAPVATVAVPYGDLDLASPEGRATLERRVSGAVRSVCGKATGLADRDAVASCERQARATAEKSMARAQSSRIAVR